jgi:hypothetical protein
MPHGRIQTVLSCGNKHAATFLQTKGQIVRQTLGRENVVGGQCQCIDYVNSKTLPPKLFNKVNLANYPVHAGGESNVHSAERQDLRNAPSTDGLERELRAVNRFGSGAAEDVILLLF